MTNKRKTGEKLLFFHESKNYFYSCLTMLSWMISDYDDGISKDDITAFITDYMSSEGALQEKTRDNFLDELFLNSADINTKNNLVKDKTSCFLSRTSDGKYTTAQQDDDNTSAVPVPYLMNIFEKRYLKTLLNSKRFRYSASSKLLNYLDDKLRDITSYDWNELIEYRGGKDSDDLLNPIVHNNIKIIAQCILENNSLHLKYKYVKGRENELQIVYPYKLMYSPLSGKMQLLCKNTTDDYILLMNVSGMSDLTIGKPHGITDDEFAQILAKKKATDPIVLEIKEINAKGQKTNAVERFFMMFSNQNKIASYDEATETYHIELQYYEFDRYEIVSRLLSLGPSVKVLSPDSIIDEIVHVAKAAYRQYRR